MSVKLEDFVNRLRAAAVTMFAYERLSELVYFAMLDATDDEPDLAPVTHEHFPQVLSEARIGLDAARARLADVAAAGVGASADVQKFANLASHLADTLPHMDGAKVELFARRFLDAAQDFERGRLSENAVNLTSDVRKVYEAMLARPQLADLADLAGPERLLRIARRQQKTLDQVLATIEEAAAKTDLGEDVLTRWQRLGALLAVQKAQAPS